MPPPPHCSSLPPSHPHPPPSPIFVPFPPKPKLLIGSRSPSFSVYAYMVVCSSVAALLLFCCCCSAVLLLMTRMTTSATMTCFSRREHTLDSHVFGSTSASSHRVEICDTQLSCCIRAGGASATSHAALGPDLLHTCCQTLLLAQFCPHSLS